MISKTNILVIILLAFATAASAQTSLAYNRTLLVDNNVQTVPANTTWKIESIMSASPYAVNSACNATNGAFDYGRAIVIDGVDIFPTSATQSSSSGSIFTTGNSNSFPFWLPAGTTVKTFCSGSKISVIEFKIAP